MVGEPRTWTKKALKLIQPTRSWAMADNYGHEQGLRSRAGIRRPGLLSAVRSVGDGGERRGAGPSRAAAGAVSLGAGWLVLHFRPLRGGLLRPAGAHGRSRRPAASDLSQRS